MYCDVGCAVVESDSLAPVVHGLAGTKDTATVHPCPVFVLACELHDGVLLRWIAYDHLGLSVRVDTA